MGISKFFKKPKELVWRRRPATATPPDNVVDAVSNDSRDLDNKYQDAVNPPSSETDDVTVQTAAVQPIDSLEAVRDEIWKTAYEKLRMEQPDIVDAFEALTKEETGIDQAAELSPTTMAQVVTKQQQFMENRQWRYTWFGREHVVRDSVETIFGVVQQASGLISLGMAAAPPYLSLPWSMVSILVPFILSDVAAVRSAVDGLEEVTDIMAKHSYAERVFLPREQTRADFQELTVPLYVSILEYQVAVALYFAKTTLERLGINLIRKDLRMEALEATKRLAQSCQQPLASLSTQLTELGFERIEESLQEDRLLLQRIAKTVFSERARREEIQRWLSPIDPYITHRTIRSQLGRDYFDSGRWFLEDAGAFLKWRSSRDEALFLQGIVGSGKSSITSMVVENVLRGSHGRLALVYCTAPGSQRTDLDSSATLGILRSLLAQLAIRPDNSISPTVLALYEQDNRAGSNNTLSDPLTVVTLIQSVLSEKPDEQITLVIDALDECADFDQVLQHVAQLRGSHSRLRVFFSARFGFVLGAQFTMARCVPINQQNSGDILGYVESEVTKRFDQAGLSSDQAERLKRALYRLAEGMFRWVELALDFYLPRPRKQRARLAPTDIEHRLVKLEQSKSTSIELLMETYEDIWNLALGDDNELTSRAAVTSAMKWVLCSLRPLSPQELLSAINTHFDEEYDKDMLFERCSNLILEDSAGYVRIAHLSVRQFFEDKLSIEFNPQTQHSEAAWCSLTVVARYRTRTEIYHEPKTPDDDKMYDCRVAGESFVLYARMHWAQHYRLCNQSMEVQEVLRKYEHSLNRPFDNFMQWAVKRTASWAQGDRRGPCIAVCDFNGAMIPRQLRQNMLHRIKGTIVDLKLLTAAGRIPDDVAFRWISASADDRVGHLHLGSSPLLYTSGSISGDDILRLNNSDELHVLDVDANGNTVLHYAAYLNHSHLIRELVERGGGLEVANLQGVTPLRIAASEVSVDTFLELIRCGASVHTSDLDPISIEPLERFIKEEIANIIATMPRAQARTRLDISMNGRRCSTCDLPKWLDASRAGTHTRCTSDLSAAALFDCTLCKSAHNFQSANDLQSEDSSELTVKVNLDAETLIKSGRDLVRYQMQGVSDLEYEVYLTQHGNHPIPQQAWDVFRGQSIQQGSSKILKDWIKACADHTECQEQQSSSILPKRLIDLESEIPRVCETCEMGPAASRYVYLSHTWRPGNSTDTRPLTLLRHNNLQQLKVGLDMEVMPTLWREAMALARELGYRFLWMDALCIVQDDPQAWQQEQGSFAVYAAQAEIVFAARNEGPFSHLDPQTSHADVCEPFLARLPDGAGCFEIHLRRPLQTAVEVMVDDVLARGWRQMEALLPKRLVVFGKEQLYWSCAHGLASQGDTKMVPAPWTSLPVMREQRKRRTRFLSARTTTEDAYKQWYYLVETSSRGGLTMAKDRLASFIGLGEEVLKFLDDKSRAGLFINNLQHGLLWIHMPEASKETRARGYGHGAEYAGPSWSWLSASKGVSHGLITGLQRAAATRQPEPEHFKLDSIDAVFEADGRDQLLRSPCVMRITSVAFAVSEAKNIELLRSFVCFFDAEDDIEVTAMNDAHFVIVAPWVYSPQGAMRWAGLVVVRREAEDHYVRAGVFLGPECDDPLSDWGKKSFTLH